ncbi:hypothetical protein ACWWJF_22230 [Symbiopectobacterium sp. Eva_TO]
MLTIISGNNRDGYPCALNKVGDIFQCGIPPIETEGLIDLGKASQKEGFWLGKLRIAAPRVVHFVEKCVFGVKRKITVPTVPNRNLILIIIILRWYSCFYICTRTVPNCTTYTRGKASSELAEAVTRKAKGDSRSQNLLFLAGLRGQMLGSVKATATGSAEVTVSMTSENSAGYGKWEPCSSLAKVRKCNFINWLNDDSGSHFSPESAKTLVSAKSRHHQIPMPEVTVTSRNTINGLAYTHMVGVCADNLLNIKPESAFVQTTGKEKGPRPALRVMQLLTCEESNELHHNSYLQATSFAPYQQTSQALGSMPLFFISRRMMRLSHAEIDSSPSCSMACRIAFSSHGSTRKATCLFPRGKFVFDICCTLGLSYRRLTMYSTFKTFVKQRSPAVLPTLTHIVIHIFWPFFEQDAQNPVN